jgi:general stress protein YciG
MASSNPANFANLPKDELKEIAAKGGHASHGSGNNDVSCIKGLHARVQGTNFSSSPHLPAAAATPTVTPMVLSPKAQSSQRS